MKRKPSRKKQSSAGLFLVFLFCVLPVFPIFVRAQTSDADARGVWSFLMLDLKAKQLPTMTDNAIDDLLQINHPDVDGIAPRFVWSTLNPASGEYNWDPIDKAIERAKAHNKKLMLRVIGGGDPKFTPDWVWGEINYVERQGLHQEIGFRLPIIWNANFLSAWNGFIKALGDRYDSNPWVQRVNINCGHGEELWYMNGDRMTTVQINQVLAFGFEDNFVNAWKNIIDGFAASFPTKPLTLNLAKTVDNLSFLKDNGKEEAITGYAMDKLGHRLYLQQEGLNETTETLGKLTSHALMKEHAANGNIIGFQTYDPARHGDLQKAFEKALAYPITYMEVYAMDLKDPSQQSAIDFIHTQLTLPVISSVSVSDIWSDSAIVKWLTNKPTDSRVEFGVNPCPCSNKTAPSAVLGTDHIVSLPGLQPNTTYYYRAESKDAFGNSVISQTDSFLTPLVVSSAVINSVSWSIANALQGENAVISALVNNGDGQTATFDIYKDHLMRDDYITTLSAKVSNGTASATWPVTYVLGNDPKGSDAKYIVKASVGSSKVWSGQLIVKSPNDSVATTSPPSDLRISSGVAPGSIDPGALGSQGTVTSADSLVGFIVGLVNWMAWIVAASATIMGLWAGALFIVAKGDAVKSSNARYILFYAVIGIAIAVLAFSIVAISKSFFKF